MANLTEAEKQEKLELLAGIAGFEEAQEMLEEAAFESVVPAICTTPGCECYADLEPDAQRDECEECGCQSIDSCLILAGVI